MLRAATRQVRRLTVENAPHTAQKIVVKGKEDLGELEAFVKEKPAGYSSQWVHLPISCASAAEMLAGHGFVYHHAYDNTSVLYRWLSDNTCRVPDFATHRVGVAGLVYDKETQKVLLVKESRGTGLWKLPGGHADLGEDIFSTAIREVKEETGIDAEFEHILCVRHSHGLAYDRSDLYFVCQLRPLTTDIRKCDFEIQDCAWLPIDKLSQSPSQLNSTLADLFAQGAFTPIVYHKQVHLLTKQPTAFYYARDPSLPASDAAAEATAATKL
ncbi:Nudix hydrolase 8 [Diplonema papillatum]|nr:Nudix hydrolase 8 [Diplonema papillatum]